MSALRAPQPRRATWQINKERTAERVLLGVRVGSDTVRSRQVVAAMRALRRACDELGVSYSLPDWNGCAVSIGGTAWEVSITERVSTAGAYGLAKTVPTGNVVIAQRITE